MLHPLSKGKEIMMCSFKMFVLSLFLTGILCAQAAPKKLACIGNSITTANGDKASYPALLDKLLGPEIDVKNFGKSGTTMLKKGDSPYWNTKQFKEVFSFKPDLITIVLASNDAEDDNWNHREGFKKDYRTFLDTLGQMESKPRFFLGLPPPMLKKKERNENLKAYIEMIKEIAAERSLPTIDLYTALVEHPEYFPDGVHPSEAGSEALADLMYEGLIKNLETTSVLTGKPVRDKPRGTWTPVLSVNTGAVRDLLGRKLTTVNFCGFKAGPFPKFPID
jgi:lysophospholipase L1-like esterase